MFELTHIIYNITPLYANEYALMRAIDWTALNCLPKWLPYAICNSVDVLPNDPIEAAVWWDRFEVSPLLSSPPIACFDDVARCIQPEAWERADRRADMPVHLEGACKRARRV